MAEENQVMTNVEENQEMKGPKEVSTKGSKEVTMKGPKKVTTKDPKKLKWVKGWLSGIIKIN